MSLIRLHSASLRKKMNEFATYMQPTIRGLTVDLDNLLNSIEKELRLEIPLSPCGRGCLRNAKAGEGSPSAEKDVSAEPTPHRTEFAAGAGAALSHKGRGRSNRHRERKEIREKTKDADQVRRADGPEKSRPEIRLH